MNGLIADDIMVEAVVDGGLVATPAAEKLILLEATIFLDRSHIWNFFDSRRARANRSSRESHLDILVLFLAPSSVLRLGDGSQRDISIQLHNFISLLL